jgi:hypothetical protein
MLALAEAMSVGGTPVLLVSPSHRQSRELFRILTEFHRRLGRPPVTGQNDEELVLANASRVVCLPCRGETIRGYSGAKLLVLDDAARVPDDVYGAVRPMLAVPAGRMICQSTPYGKRGFFWDAWAHGGDDWARIEVPASQIPRIAPSFLEAERRGMGESSFRQKYGCSFEAVEGLVHPNLDRCVAYANIPLGDRWVGGIDFGDRNPFAAVWGYLTDRNVLVLTGEHYCRQQPLSHHAPFLPRQVTWSCDPPGATEQSELRRAGFTVRAARNALHPGIAAVNARIQSGTLLIREGACPNLLAEAGLYRYSDDPAEHHAEIPVDEYNHALAALRYLILMTDAHRPAGQRPAPAQPKRRWLSVYNEFLWTRISPPE